MLHWLWTKNCLSCYFDLYSSSDWLSVSVITRDCLSWSSGDGGHQTSFDQNNGMFTLLYTGGSIWLQVFQQFCYMFLVKDDGRKYLSQLQLNSMNMRWPSPPFVSVYPFSVCSEFRSTVVIHPTTYPPLRNFHLTLSRLRGRFMEVHPIVDPRFFLY